MRSRLKDAAFEVVFGLLDLPSSASSTSEPTPFVNRPLLADYQHVYDLSKTFGDLTNRVDDARTELVESALRALDVGTAPAKPGVLRVLLRSSGMPPGIDNLGRGPSHADTTKDKGKGKAVAQPSPSAITAAGADPVLDAAVAQVLEVFPDQPSEYVRFLLAHADYPYRGNSEKLIGALLEGTAPSLEEVESAIAHAAEGGSPTRSNAQPEYAYTTERRNVFDGQDMDLSQVRVGKKREDASVLLHDRSFIEQMKVDILRRAEEVSDSEEEGEGKKDIDIAFEDEVDEVAPVKVRDGDVSEEDGEGTDDGEDEVGCVLLFRV